MLDNGTINKLEKHSPTTIRCKPLMFFTVANNLLALTLRPSISPWATTTNWNNYENLEDGSFDIKHFERYS
jgi:hypothetical protein